MKELSGSSDGPAQANTASDQSVQASQNMKAFTAKVLSLKWAFGISRHGLRSRKSSKRISAKQAT
jgi:hypothetical protein